jgi:hypothetical protein
MSMSRWYGTNRPTRNPSGGKARAALGAIRYTGALIRQLPLQPLLAALLMSLVLGILPMILTALCSAACTVQDWCRDAGRPHHHPPANKSRPVELINQMELL